MNHVLYGNRAQACLKLDTPDLHRLALTDGLRAIILKDDWVKGHFRYIQAAKGMGLQAKASFLVIDAKKQFPNDASIASLYAEIVEGVDEGNLSVTVVTCSNQFMHNNVQNPFLKMFRFQFVDKEII